MKFSGSHILIGGVAVLAAAGLLWSNVFAVPCNQPLAYSIGTIDERFDISTSTVRDLLRDAEAVWEEQTGIERELFVYDPDADFTIKFIFDERQQTTDTVNQFEDTLSDIEGSHDSIITAYEEAKTTYEEAVDTYETRRQAYEADLAAYNDEVSYWNDQGGAPPKVYEQLRSQRQKLNDRLEDLQAEQDDIEALQAEVNKLASRGNSLAQVYNETAATFAARFGGTREFNQATYVGDAINVYQFETPDDLRLALVHEFGHALGIEHVTSSESIMYYLMDSQSLEDITLSEEDIAAFKSVCSNV